MTVIPCPKCHNTQYVVKAGSNGGGSQRLRCQQCQSYFTPDPKPMGYDPSVREQALRLYLEGNSLRSIGRTLHVHHQSVANWIDVAERQLPEQVADQTPTGTVEVDELRRTIYSCRQKNRRAYVVVAVSCFSRLVVGAQVMWERSWEKMQAFADELPAANCYCTDHLAVYSELVWPDCPDYEEA